MNEIETEHEKDIRRRILKTLPNWNVGITPSGKLARLPCFVLQSVPNIIPQTEDRIDNALFSTKSEWAANLVKSNISTSTDTETLKSLSACKSIFQNNEPTTDKNATKTVHMIRHHVKAYIAVDDIARLTTDFDEELKQAQEHWPHSPQKSWDKMCLIWEKYGFLWPQRVHIGFKIYEKWDVDDIVDDIEEVRDSLLEVRSQDRLHSPRFYSIIWRTELKPVHEYFTADDSEKKEFVKSLIQHFSILVLNDSLFRLINVRSGDLLGRFDSSSLSNSNQNNGGGGVFTIPFDNTTNTTTSNFCWKFNGSITTTMEQSASFISKGEKKIFYSGQQPLDNEVTILSKLQQQQNNTTILPTAGVKLIQFTPPIAKISDKMNENWRWHIGTSNPETDFFDGGIFNLEEAIDNQECLKHGDEITLNQQSYYLRSTNNFTNNSFHTSKSPMERQHMNTISPQSAKSFGDRYNFSPMVASGSNITQPTSGANSAVSSLSSLKRIQSPSRNASIVCLEKLSSIAASHSHITQPLFAHYRWRIELVSKTLKEEEDKITQGMESISLKSDQSNVQNVASTTFKTYEPMLNMDISRLTSPAESHTTKPTINNDILVSSMVVIQDNTDFVHQQLLQPKPQQQSKWLSVNPQLYNLQKQTVQKVEIEDDRRSASSSQYKTPIGSPPSITSLKSPTSSFTPKYSEKKIGKQPLQAPKLVLSPNYKNTPRTQTFDTESDDSWSSSESPSSPIDKNVDLNIVAPTNVTGLSEAEAFKRGIQQNYIKDQEANELEHAHATILNNILAPSPKSNTTSQIRYYDEDNDEFFDHGGSSQVRTYTVTPRSKYSQLTPSSTANLSPEEYLNWRRCRENSFMLLVDRETKQQFWLKAIKESSLGHLLNVFSPAVKKFKKSKQQNVIHYPSARSMNSNNSANLHQSNRIIQKKKGFYNKKNRRADGIVI